MRFLDRLRRTVEIKNSLLCVGLDPELDRLPEGFPRTSDGIVAFNRAVVDATQDYVCAYKPNLAFYEALGPDGDRVLRDTLRAIPSNVLTIGDAKRADIGNTSRFYAKALFEVFGFDAVTANPYLGGDALQPFLDDADHGTFVLCRTSNPGASDFQSLPVRLNGAERPLYEVVARRAGEWNRQQNVGLVVGATAPAELARVRALAPALPFLVPGIGAQAGDLAAAVGSSRDDAPSLISASRSVLYAASGTDFAVAAERAAREMRNAIQLLRRA